MKLFNNSSQHCKRKHYLLNKFRTKLNCAKIRRSGGETANWIIGTVYPRTKVIVPPLGASFKEVITRTASLDDLAVTSLVCDARHARQRR